MGFVLARKRGGETRPGPCDAQLQAPSCGIVVDNGFGSTLELADTEADVVTGAAT